MCIAKSAIGLFCRNGGPKTKLLRMSVHTVWLVSRYQMIQTRLVWYSVVYCLKSMPGLAGGCLSNKCGKCPLTMLIYCGLVGSDLHGPTVRTFEI